MESTKQSEEKITIVVIGASGDLAKKKTYPALRELFDRGFLPKNVKIVGFARTKLTKEDFHKSLAKYFPGGEVSKHKEFLNLCDYFPGQYNSASDFQKLDEYCQKLEKGKANRIFYFAIPPSIFVEVGKSMQPAAMSKTGWNRVIVEKPFGKDLESSNQLGKQLAAIFEEDQIYRIDHYLGKEMVQNLMTVRFSNAIFEPLWNRKHISLVQITFKEDFGTEGRGGYFDEFGIIRDVMQNHLCQVLSLVAMEPPATLDAEDVRNAKVKVLTQIPPIQWDHVVLGQYTKNEKTGKPGYLDDKTVPAGSNCPTFASAVLFINNDRWHGVPFILKCGKALEQRKAEIRIHFYSHNYLYGKMDTNELVLRVQPDSAIYLKFRNKKPGLTNDTVLSELDLSYKNRFKNDVQPEAYERLILDVIRGDHNLFVRSDELVASWKIFTPLLHKIENEKIKPIPYVYGSRGPQEADDLAQKFGFVRTLDYVYENTK